MTVYLNERLRNFFSNIKLDYQYNGVFNLDYMDYFPLLKNGYSIIDTYYNIIYLFGVKNNYIDTDRRINDNVVRTIFEKYEGDGDDEFLLTARELDRNEINMLKSQHEIELELSIQLIKVFNIKPLESGYFSFKPILLHHLKNIYLDSMCFRESSSNVRLAEQVTTNENIRVLYYVINGELNDLIEMLLIEDFDPRIGNNCLYHLSLEMNFNQVANMIKNCIIKRNWIEKQALIKMFNEHGIGEDIYYYITR